jgi:hypothetical protein
MMQNSTFGFKDELERNQALQWTFFWHVCDPTTTLIQSLDQTDAIAKFQHKILKALMAIWMLVLEFGYGLRQTLAGPYLEMGFGGSFGSLTIFRSEPRVPCYLSPRTNDGLRSRMVLST